MARMVATIQSFRSLSAVSISVGLLFSCPFFLQPGQAQPLASNPAQPNNAQFYQDYQPVSSPLPPASAPAPVATGSTNEADSSALPPAQNPIGQPVWVVPQGSTPTATPGRPMVTVPAPNAPGTPNRSPAPPRAAGSANELFVTATEVQIIGAEADLQQIIRDRIRTQPGGATNNSQLQSDVAAILDTGLFTSATVSSRPNANGLSVVFRVQPIVIRSFRLSGARVLTPDVVNDIFRNQIGQVINPTALNQGIRQVNQWYAERGYTLGRVLAAQPDRSGVVTVEVAEGTIGEIRVRFVDEFGRTVDDQGQPIRGRTRPDFIQRQIQLRPGQVFQEPVAKQDLNRLNQLGLFSQTSVTFEGDSRRLVVIYNLAERRSRAINVGAGYNDDLGLFGSVTFQDQNVNGVGQRLSTSVLVGTRDVQFDGRFVSPYRSTDPETPGYSFGGFRRRGLSRVFDDEIRLANGDRVRESRFGGDISVNRPISPEWDGRVSLGYVRTSLRDDDGRVVKTDARGNPLSFSGRGIDDLVTIGFTATRDQRDNPADPTRGSLLTLSTEQSLPIGLGNILSNRLQANFVQYIPVNFIKFADESQQRQLLAFNLQGGTVVGDLAPYNAYTLGGINSVRGYGTADVGIGRSYLLASTEYRFPIYQFITGALFADFATDLGSAESVLGQPGIQRNRPGSGFGVGAGVRFKSPIGIIRADFGINDQGESRLQFGFGQRF